MKNAHLDFSPIWPKTAIRIKLNRTTILGKPLLTFQIDESSMMIDTYQISIKFYEVWLDVILGYRWKALLCINKNHKIRSDICVHRIAIVIKCVLLKQLKIGVYKEVSEILNFTIHWMYIQFILNAYLNVYTTSFTCMYNIHCIYNMVYLSRYYMVYLSIYTTSFISEQRTVLVYS